MFGENKTPTTSEAVKAYEATINIFEALLREIKELAKKKPEAPMSAFKVTQLNRILADIKGFLKDEVEVKYLDLLDDEALPQVADALVVMAQFEGALKGFHLRHYGYNGLQHTWFIENDGAAGAKKNNK